MPRGPVRRGQLIAPFGPGAMLVLPDGTSVICGGLDHWFKHETGDDTNIDRKEYEIDEWRLARRLNVNRFYLPPDYRRIRRGEVATNAYLTIPFLRFPQWHYCTICGFMVKLPLVTRGRVRCSDCEGRGRTRFLVQVPFVAMCDAGHIQDFPWLEWVYRRPTPPQNGPAVRLMSTGGMTLAGQKISVDSGPERTLAGITNAQPDGSDTDLSRTLDESGTPFLCPGGCPWLGTEDGLGCGRPLRGTLRSAANVYFAQVRNSIYLPRGEDATVSEVVSLLERPPLSTFVNVLQSAGIIPAAVQLRQQYGELLGDFSDNQIDAAISVIGAPTAADEGGGDRLPSDDAETSFRRQEFNTLSGDADYDQLVLRPANLADYEPQLGQCFGMVTLVHKLRETRALTGFTRVLADTDQELSDLQAMLRREPGPDRWLPAYVVFGEGIFLTLNEDKLQRWEVRSDVLERVAPLAARYDRMRVQRRLRDRRIGPRFLLLHTLAHLLINRLTFECGYSSAALREKIYVSENRDAPMAGILIYTAAGDAEGTLGGLVRMGGAGKLGPVLLRALEGARWCSADPVCMEMGASAGQGPDSLNLAACHGCTLVPETACEEFNRLLDRAVAIGTSENPSMGFFGGAQEA